MLSVASLTRGLSGVRPVVVERLIALLNAGITPVVPERGSVGASGDLAPLAHAVLVLLGDGEAWHNGGCISGRDALGRLGAAPLVLEAKEGLALINGTHLMTALGALAHFDAERLFSAALNAAAMSADACRGGIRRGLPPQADCGRESGAGHLHRRPRRTALSDRRTRPRPAALVAAYCR